MPLLFFCISHAIAEDAVDRAMKATISIFPASVDDQAGGGSGVVISPDGYALTNFHVVQPCGPAMKCAMSDGKLYDAVVVGLDPVGDIALIKLIMDNGELIIEDSGASSSSQNDEAEQNADDGTSFEAKSPHYPLSIIHYPFPYVPLADSDAVAVGDPAIVMGNPFLLALDFKPCVSRGIISGVHRYQFPSGTFLEYTDCLQTDAAVNPGNSGGPLFNEKGEVIGIIGRCSFEKRGRVNVGIGYAVSSNQVRYFLGDLKSGRIVDHATMNAVVSTDKEGRVLFDDVLGTSDAYRSGLRYNDQLLRFAGRTIDTANAFKNIIGIFPKGWRLPVTVRGKDGERFELFVRLSGLHTESELVEMTQKMIEPPIVPPGRPGAQPPALGDDEKIPPGFKEIEVPGPDGKPIKVLQKEHFIPDSVKPFYEKQRGYANFHFNRLELDRVLTAWRKSFDHNAATAWKFSGRIENRSEKFSFEIDEKGVKYELPLGDGFWDAGLMKREEILMADPLMHYQSPRGSGGLFTALYLMRELAVREKFEAAEIVYVGTAPLDGRLDRLYDQCAMSWLGNDVRFYFDPNDGALVLVEMFGSGLDFPCELRFGARDGEKRFEIRYGRILFGTFEIAGETVPALPITADLPKNTGLSKETGSAPTGVTTRTSSSVIAETLTKVVKIYGASGATAGGAGLHGYQTGILVSPDGDILTAITPTLQADPITVILDSGRKYEARLVQAEPGMELALLKIPASDLPFFSLGESASETETDEKTSDQYGFDDSIHIGDAVLAISNPFNIAQGNESASVQRGAIAARTTLRARRGVFETPYKGPICVVDFTTNNPGACGGALVREETGELIGMLGKELRNRENNSWLNFALPTFAFRETVRDMIQRTQSGEQSIRLLSPDAVKPEQELIPEDTITILQSWGILLVPTVARRTPPFIDSIKPGSEAEKQGLLPDDLIVMVNDRLTPSLTAVEYQIHQSPPGEPIRLTVEREMVLRDVAFPKKP